MPTALNQTGQQSLTVTGVAVQITLPTYTDYSDGITAGFTRNQTPRHALIQVYDQPVRYASNLTVAPSGVTGLKLLPGDTLDLTDPQRDYYGFLSNLQFVTDVDATGDAQVEIAYFA